MLHPQRDRQLRHFTHEGTNFFEVGILRDTARVSSRSSETFVQAKTQTGDVGFVLLEVPIEVRLLTETAFAEGALEGAFLVVDVSHVALQVARYAEGTLAVFALVGLFAGMCPQVTREVRGTGEYFATELARVAIFVLGGGTWR